MQASMSTMSSLAEYLNLHDTTPNNAGLHAYDATQTTSSADAEEVFSLTRVPMQLRNMGVSRTYSPGVAAASSFRHSTNINNKSHLNRTPSSLSMTKNEQGPMTPTGASQQRVLTKAKPATASAVAPWEAASAETRAQEFYHRLQEAAKRELLMAQIKSPTRDGVVIDKDKTPLQFARVSLKEPGVLTRRLQTVHRELFDQMIDEAAPATAALQHQGRAFKENSLRASHVALFATSASAAATLGMNRSGLASNYVNPNEFNPYFPTSTRNAPALAVAQPLLVAVPDPLIMGTASLTDACPFSPTKGPVGTIAISSTTGLALQQQTPLAITNRNQVASSFLTPSTPVVTDLGATSATTPPPPPLPQQQPQSKNTRPLSLDEKATLIHACKFVLQRPMTDVSGMFFAAPYQFEKTVGTSVATASKMLQQMEARIHDWDELDMSSIEYRSVIKMLRVLIDHHAWMLPSIGLPSGSGRTSKLKVLDVVTALQTTAP